MIMGSKIAVAAAGVLVTGAVVWQVTRWVEAGGEADAATQRTELAGGVLAEGERAAQEPAESRTTGLAPVQAPTDAREAILLAPAAPLADRGLGAIIATEQGRTTPYSLYNIQERATLFVGPGVPVYEGQIVGENRRAANLNVNVCRAKKLTNIRAANRDEATVVSTPRPLTIESALEWIEDDELLEVTPKALRLRKRILAGNLRKRSG